MDANLEDVMEAIRAQDERFRHTAAKVDAIHSHTQVGYREIPKISASIENLAATIGRTMLALIAILGLCLVLMVWRGEERDLSIGGHGLDIKRAQSEK